MTPVFTAENQGGDIIIIHAEAGFHRESFTTYVLSHMRELDGDDPNANYLALYEWDEHETFARWLMGSECVPWVSWPRMAEEACYGSLEYVYPGRIEFLRPNERQTPPPPFEFPVSGDDGLSIFDAVDPKSEGWHDRMSSLYDNREKGQ
jgi:hypothetical protein